MIYKLTVALFLVVLFSVASIFLTGLQVASTIGYHKDSLIDRLKYKPKGRHRAH